MLTNISWKLDFWGEMLFREHYARSRCNKVSQLRKLAKEKKIGEPDFRAKSLANSIGVTPLINTLKANYRIPQMPVLLVCCACSVNWIKTDSCLQSCLIVVPFLYLSKQADSLTWCWSSNSNAGRRALTPDIDMGKNRGKDFTQITKKSLSNLSPVAYELVFINLSLLNAC